MNILEVNEAPSFLRKIFGTGLTGAEREANAFSSSEAQIQRNWEQKMYEQYESIPAQMRQYREAGINPALMYEGAPSVGSVGSSAAASSVTPANGGNPIDMLFGISQQVMQARSLAADIDLKSSAAERNRAEANATNQKLPEEIESLRSGVKLNEAQITKYTADVEKVKADTALATQHLEESKAREALHKADISVSEARAALIRLQTFTQRIDAKYRESYWQALTANLAAQSALADAYTQTDNVLRESAVKSAEVRANNAEALLKAQIENIISSTKLSEKERKFMFTRIMSAVGTVAVGGAALGSVGVKILGTATKAVAPPIIPSLYDDTMPVESILN